MSILDSTALKDILAQILFPPAERAEQLPYIVPKQGNWFNPKESKALSKNTWIGYRIKSRTSQLKGTEIGVVIDTTEYAANQVFELLDIELQFVGEKAEQLAASVMHWPKRADAAEAFAEYSGVIRDDIIRVDSAYFKQEGYNTIYSYNVTFRVYCTSVIASTSEKLKTVTYQ